MNELKSMRLGARRMKTGKGLGEAVALCGAYGMTRTDTRIPQALVCLLLCLSSWGTRASFRNSLNKFLILHL